jgi:hypothetical protein
MSASQPIGEVRHNGVWAKTGRACHHLLFKIVTDGVIQIACDCGGLVEISADDLRKMADELEAPHQGRNWLLIKHPV